jgi:hypothetical protein
MPIEQNTRAKLLEIVRSGKPNLDAGPGLITVARGGNTDIGTRDPNNMVGGLGIMVADLRPSGQYWSWEHDEQERALPFFLGRTPTESQVYVTEIEALQVYIAQVLKGRDDLEVRDQPSPTIIDELVSAIVPGCDFDKGIMRGSSSTIASKRNYMEAALSLMYGAQPTRNLTRR